MKLSPNATKGHLVVGVVLIALALISLIACLVTPSKILVFLIFFSGVWGGIETGRYLEFILTRPLIGNQTEEP